MTTNKALILAFMFAGLALWCVLGIVVMGLRIVW